MPSHTVSSALIQLYHENGAPWDWPRWKSITGVKYGLFPEDDDLLPSGWTRDNADSVRSYFDAYRNIEGEEAKIKFSQNRAGQAIPGRDFWKAWVTKRWAAWEIHSVIAECFTKANVHPLSLIVSADDLDHWPDANLYLPVALDSIAEGLFGSGAFNEHGHIHHGIRRATALLAQRTWMQLNAQAKRGKSNMENLKQAALEAFDALNKGTPTANKVSTTIRAVSRWKNMTKIFAIKQVVREAEEMQADLDTLMSYLGAPTVTKPTKVKVKTKGLCKLTREALHGLASDHEVYDLFCLYKEYFEANNDAPIVDDPRSLVMSLAPCDAIQPMDPISNSADLGLTDQLPLQFNRYRHNSGFTAWDGTTRLVDFSRPGPDLQPLALHPHQLDAIRFILRCFFTENSQPGKRLGALLADEVGLGKTAVVIGTIALLNHIVLCQSASSPVPPLIQRMPYLGASTSVPALAHVVVCPGTLMAQWEHEIKFFFRRRAVEIFMYVAGQTAHEEFWAETGPFHSSKHIVTQRIIIVSSSALQQDFTKVFLTPSSRSMKTWTFPSRRLGSQDRGTLYGRKYLSVTIDEAHLYRNTGAKQHAVLALLENASARILLTATPIVTNPGDAYSMGRMTGCEYFFSDKALQDEKQDTSELRKAKKTRNYDSDDEDQAEREEALKNKHFEAVKRVNKYFEGRVINRTASSLDWEGKPLLQLPPCHIIRAVLTPTEREEEILKTLSATAQENAAVANASGKFYTRNFFVDYRRATCFAKEGPNDEIPHFDSLQQWEAVKSTKLDACARICEHILSRDDVPPVEFVDGLPVFHPAPPINPGQPILRTKRILIYQEFPSMFKILQNVLNLYGIPSLSIDGQMSFEKRDAVVSRFHEPDAPRVFIFSKVGIAGLNLSIASTVLNVDQVWSAQDEKQIRGRAHRQPQKEEVFVYHLLIQGTIDEHVAGIARGKQDMLEGFFNQDVQETLQVLSGKTVVSALEDDEEPEKVQKKRKGKRQASKTVNEEDDLEGLSTTTKKTKTRTSRKPKNVTSREYVEDEDPPQEDSSIPQRAENGGRDAVSSDGDALSTTDGGGFGTSDADDFLSSDGAGFATSDGDLSARDDSMHDWPQDHRSNMIPGRLDQPQHVVGGSSHQSWEDSAGNPIDDNQITPDYNVPMLSTTKPPEEPHPYAPGAGQTTEKPTDHIRITVPPRSQNDGAPMELAALDEESAGPKTLVGKATTRRKRSDTASKQNASPGEGKHPPKRQKKEKAAKQPASLPEPNSVTPAGSFPSTTIGGGAAIPNAPTTSRSTSKRNTSVGEGKRPQAKRQKKEKAAKQPASLPEPSSVTPAGSVLSTTIDGGASLPNAPPTQQRFGFGLVPDGAPHPFDVSPRVSTLSHLHAPGDQGRLKADHGNHELGKAPAPKTMHQAASNAVAKKIVPVENIQVQGAVQSNTSRQSTDTPVNRAVLPIGAPPQSPALAAMDASGDSIPSFYKLSAALQQRITPQTPQRVAPHWINPDVATSSGFVEGRLPNVAPKQSQRPKALSKPDGGRSAASPQQFTSSRLSPSQQRSTPSAESVGEGSSNTRVQRPQVPKVKPNVEQSAGRIPPHRQPTKMGEISPPPSQFIKKK